ncbi:hypothetical protein GCM10011390_40990 [Aureimonas endophytica]|uniref:Uncharacterized protein n=1 Tax=Aureimonas endophytica TaxID=2027858 RepID=A0A916ZZ30_9HYPH|nr:hypothetical protein [Aureimonas endophytica]GGE17649.1 hypothetical protein GCM10011390_40990 [Aureimonas endophytica]
MSKHDAYPREAPLAPATEPEREDLAELVDDAVKALRIGGVLATDDALRQAVDELKHQIEADRATV